MGSSSKMATFLCRSTAIPQFSSSTLSVLDNSSTPRFPVVLPLDSLASAKPLRHGLLTIATAMPAGPFPLRHRPLNLEDLRGAGSSRSGSFSSLRISICFLSFSFPLFKPSGVPQPVKALSLHAPYQLDQTRRSSIGLRCALRLRSDLTIRFVVPGGMASWRWT
jgi:hypothetical protein